MSLIEWPFRGLPWPVQGVFDVALVIALLQLIVVGMLAVTGTRERRRADGHHTGHECDFLWVFVVPALNEEVTIGDTIDHLLEVDATHRVIAVIDDASDDGTAQILAQRPEQELQVISRTFPEARKGKAAALNMAWSMFHEGRIESPMRDFSEEQVLLVVVDADGRLDPNFCTKVAPYFSERGCGGVQVCVRIYNRLSALTRTQDIEFRVFDDTFQLGRSYWGTAVLGGNGQVTRLAALTDVAVANSQAGWSEGPWRRKLTEDQDLGISLIVTGWRVKQDMRAYVSQQGLNSFRKLFRQRTRWAQGNIEAMSRAADVLHSDVPRFPRLELLYSLFQPFAQAIIGISMLMAVVLAVLDPSVVFSNIGWGTLFLLLSVSIGATLIGVIRAQCIGIREHPVRGVIWAVLSIPLYSMYIWTLLPAVLVAGVKHVRGQSTWAKTEREPIPR